MPTVVRCRRGMRVLAAAYDLWLLMVDVSRRQVLMGAMVMPTLLGGCAANLPAERRPPSASVAIGASDRIRGVNIGPAVADFVDESAWAGLWRRWDWDGRIKLELDDAVELGASGIRLIGNTHVVTSNIITRDTYLRQWTQFLEYTKSIGLRVYPCGGDLRHWGDTTLQAAENLYQGWAELFIHHDHVIGADITNEAPAQSKFVGGIAYNQPESWLYTVKRLGELVRAVSGKPITHSRGLTTYDAASWEFGSPETDVLSDFLDVHAYHALSPNDADGLYASEWGGGKQLIIGEFGANMTLDSAARTADYEGIRGLIASSTNCVGGFAWAIRDTGTDPASLFGLYDENRVPREDIAGPFRKFPVVR
jgi:hypothetical protein